MAMATRRLQASKRMPITGEVTSNPMRINQRMMAMPVRSGSFGTRPAAVKAAGTRVAQPKPAITNPGILLPAVRRSFIDSHW